MTTTRSRSSAPRRSRKEELLIEYGFGPEPRHFHKLDERWVQDYDWRIKPATGPYNISRLEKGQFIEFKRNPRTGGATRTKYFANRYNVDTIRVTVIRDTNVAWEYFLNGELDWFPLVLAELLARKGGRRAVRQGLRPQDQVLHRQSRSRRRACGSTWTTRSSRTSNVRLGLAHAMNVDLMLKTVLRGDYERLKGHYEGYGDYSNPAVQALPFDLAKADEHFKAAGWTTRGPDGIRIKDGQRLAFSVTYGTRRAHGTARRAARGSEESRHRAQLAAAGSSATFKQIQREEAPDRVDGVGRRARRRSSGSTIIPRTRTSRRPTTSRTPTIRSST